MRRRRSRPRAATPTCCSSRSSAARCRLPRTASGRLHRPRCGGPNRRRAGPPGRGAGAGLHDLRSGFCVLHRQWRRSHAGRGAPLAERLRPRRSGVSSQRAHDRALRSGEPQRRPAALRAGRISLPLDGRRREARRSRGRRPEPRLSPGQDPAAGRQRGHGPAPTDSHPDPRRCRPETARPGQAAPAPAAGCAARSLACAATRPARCGPPGCCGSASAASGCGARPAVHSWPRPPGGCG